MLKINNYDLRLILVLSDFNSDVYYRMIYGFVKRWSGMSKELNFIGINLCVIYSCWEFLEYFLIYLKI